MADEKETQKGIDQRYLKSKSSLEARQEALFEIGQRYGVRIWLKEADKSNQRNSMFIRECPKHGKQEVRMSAFLSRGNFGCPDCARDKQSEYYAKLRNQ